MPAPDYVWSSLEWAHSLWWGRSGPPFHTLAISHLYLHCPRRPSPLSALTPTPSLSPQSKWQEGEQSAREQDFCCCCLSPRGWKPLMTALALRVPVPSSIPTTQGLKPQEPHSLPGSLAIIKAFSTLSLGLPQAPWLKSDKGPLCWNCQSLLLRRELETSGISWGTDKALDSCQKEHD